MPGYIPPNLRNDPKYKPKKLTYRPKIIWSELKTKDQLFEEYRKQNYGKADAAWEEDQLFVTNDKS